MLRYILFHHQTTTTPAGQELDRGCVISSFITKPQPVFLMCCNMIQLHDEYCTGNGMVNSLSMAKLLKKLKLNRLLLYFLFYLSPYIDDVGVLLVGYRDYTKSSLAGHEEFYSLDVYIPWFEWSTETNVHTILVHYESVAFKTLAENCIIMFFLLADGW